MLKPGDRFEISRQCPHCTKLHRRATFIDSESIPFDKDEETGVTLCTECGNWCIIVNETTLRKPTPAEEREIRELDVAKRVRLAWLLASRH